MTSQRQRKRRRRQKQALQRVIDASERLGLYRREDEELLAKVRDRLTRRHSAVSVELEDL